MTLIFSSGDRSSVKNYRPISLLCSLSKVLERLVFDQMISFLSPIITPSQFGFLKGRSTQQQLLVDCKPRLIYFVTVTYTELWRLFDPILSLTRVVVIHLVFYRVILPFLVTPSTSDLSWSYHISSIVSNYYKTKR